ncbi:MAG: hypothetical protein IKG21_05585 [Atopobiaceae bacterium]|nr:hypothetical protein [Atopobiaceae bacterium]
MSDGEGHVFEPRFTYYGYRYVSLDCSEVHGRLVPDESADEGRLPRSTASIDGRYLEFRLAVQALERCELPHFPYEHEPPSFGEAHDVMIRRVVFRRIVFPKLHFPKYDGLLKVA